MLFPIIKVVDNDQKDKVFHIVGTNSHDLLEIDEESGGIQYLNMHCCEGTKKYDGTSTFSFHADSDDCFGPRIEMVTFERLCEIYLEQTALSIEHEKKMHEVINRVREAHDQMVDESGLLDDGICDTGGTLL